MFSDNMLQFYKRKASRMRTTWVNFPTPNKEQQTEASRTVSHAVDETVSKWANVILYQDIILNPLEIQMRYLL